MQCSAHKKSCHIPVLFTVHSGMRSFHDRNPNSHYFIAEPPRGSSSTGGALFGEDREGRIRRPSLATDEEPPSLLDPPPPPPAEEDSIGAGHNTSGNGSSPDRRTAHSTTSVKPGLQLPPALQTKAGGQVTPRANGASQGKVSGSGRVRASFCWPVCFCEWRRMEGWGEGGKRSVKREQVEERRGAVDRAARLLEGWWCDMCVR